MICFSFSWAFTHGNFSGYNSPILNFNTSKLVYLGTLSEDHIGNTMPTGAIMIPYSRIEDLNTPTLSHGTYPYSPYMGASPKGLSAVYLATFERSSPPPLFPSFTFYIAVLH